MGNMTAAPIVAEGPVVLHGSISDQWGGHTFGYLVQGRDALFWAATLHSPGGPPTALVGQHPLPGSSTTPAVTRLAFTAPNVKGNNQPQMVCASDGHLHIFVGVTYTTDDPKYNYGRIHYYRSERPEDVSTLVDKTARIPLEPFVDFHLRMNAAISPDGSRIVLVILAISPDGSVPFNTPVLFVGERQGADYVFRRPVVYARPMGFFYPQVAALDDGIVLVGEVWDNYERPITRILHIDWDGNALHEEDLPHGSDGTFLSFDMKPISPDQPNRLVIYYNRQSKDHSDNAHEFWEYDAQRRSTRLLRSIPSEYSFSNAGKWVRFADGSSAFINNPSMGKLHVWGEDVLESPGATPTPLVGADLLALGYRASAYVFTPNPFQGSLASPDGVYIASDCFNPSREDGKSGPSSFLFWKLRRRE